MNCTAHTRGAWLGMLVTLFAAGASLADDSAHRVTYIASNVIYIDAGREDGLRVDDRIEVVRDGRVIATLRVTDLASHRAACVIETVTAVLATGDTIRYTAGIPAAPAPTAATTAGTSVAVTGAETADRARAGSRLRSWGLRGRIGIRYLSVIDRSGFGGDLSQPSGDVRLDGYRVAGQPIDLQVDARARRTQQTISSGQQFNENEMRVYRMNMALRSRADHYRLTVGRQFSSAFASVSTFDGAQAEYNTARFGAGVFGGTQPDPVDYGYSTEITEYGAFVHFHAGPQALQRWDAVVAGVGSYTQGKINREYIALQGRYTTQRLMATLLQEIDANRGWKSTTGEPLASLTSTFAMARYRLTPELDLDGGFDNRRNVRLYRDYVTPETEFDDSYRQGVWGGATANLMNRYRLGASARLSSGGVSGDATSYTLAASANRIPPINLQLRLRSTRYDNMHTEGWMHLGTVAWSSSARWQIELHAGHRDENAKAVAVPSISTSWFGTDVDFGFRNNLYLNVSAERNENAGSAYDQVYTGLSWRF